MPKVTPNGQKIKQLRKVAGIKQNGFGKRISERQIRNVERQNHPIDEHVLVNIAGALKVRPAEIMMEESKEALESKRTNSALRGEFKLQLDLMNTGGQFVRFISYCDEFRWETDIDPNKKTAPLMEDLLKIVDYQCKKWTNLFTDDEPKDEFDDLYQFPELHRIARANEILEILREEKVSVLANKYYSAGRNKVTKVLQIVEKALICFVSSEVTSKLVEIKPDVYDLMYEEANKSRPEASAGAEA